MDSNRRTTPGPLNPAGPAPGGATRPDVERAGAALALEAPEERHRGARSKVVRRDERDHVWDTLNTEPWSLDFFQTVRRIEACYPELPGFGWSNRASEDPLRFCQKPSLAFPPCTLQEFDPANDRHPARLFVNFIGMLGPHGPMPLHITEYAFERDLHHKDRTISRFLDVFNHRIVSLFYRAWAASQLPASFDRWTPVPDAGSMSEVERQQALLNDSDRYAIYIGSLFGLGMPGVRHRDAVADNAKLHFAGRLVGHHRGPEGLRAILSDYLGIEVEVEEFAGRWLEIPGQDHCILGRSSPSAGTLAGKTGLTGAVMGARVWDAQGMFRLRLGPMSLAEYQRFLPGSTAARRLEAWIRNYVGDEFAWEAVLVLRSGQVPRSRLGAGTRLGWTSWVTTQASPEDRADLALRSRT